MILLVLALCSVLAPGVNVWDYAQGTAWAIENSAPLYERDEYKHKTAAIMVAIGYRESTFKTDAIGDNGNALCAYQLWNTSRDVLTDSRKCATIALDRVRESMRICGASNPLGIYASGPRGCSSEKAKRISADRTRLARHTLAEVMP